MTKSILLIFIIFFTLSCSKIPKNVKISFDLAGKNKEELQAVLDHFQAEQDSLKLQAAYFLIGNMWNKYCLEGDGLDAYDFLFDSLYRINNLPDKSAFDWINQDRKRKKTKQAWVNLNNSVGDVYNNLSMVYDVQNIKADYLIENIEYAFKAWELPWANHLTFEEFCEFVLPYRYQNETLIPWRKQIFESTDFSKLQGVTDPIEACKIMNRQFSDWFVFNDLFYKYPRALNYEEILQGKNGSCREQTGLSIYAMRAIGIPVAHELIHKWVTLPIGHNLSSVRGKDGKHIKFQGAESNPREYDFLDPVSKIFRKTYKIQAPLHLPDTEEYIPDFFKGQNIMDDTGEFIPVANVTINMDNIDQDHVFLCTFDGQKWEPIAMTIRQGKEAEFRNMGRGVIYLPVILSEYGKTLPIGNPILVDDLGDIQEIKPSGTPIDSMVLFRKFPLKQRHIDRTRNLIDGRFQASNFRDFRDAVDLMVVRNKPAPPYDFVTRKFDTQRSNKYRYVRYLMPPIKDEGCNIADVSFYGEGGSKLEGERFGSNWVNDHHLDIAFNGNLGDYLIALKGDTSQGIIDHVVFIEDTTDFDNIWLAMDLGEKQIIKQIGLTPRSDTNNIYEECMYELFYWDNRWVSLGQKNGVADKLLYKNVPKGTLFWLRNLTRGKEERIFIYDNGEQVFY